jgi:hypothetical protein
MEEKMKKVLILGFVLMLAMAGSAWAEQDHDGKVTGEIEIADWYGIQSADEIELSASMQGGSATTWGAATSMTLAGNCDFDIDLTFAPVTGSDPWPFTGLSGIGVLKTPDNGTWGSGVGAIPIPTSGSASFSHVVATDGNICLLWFGWIGVLDPFAPGGTYTAAIDVVLSAP